MLALLVVAIGALALYDRSGREQLADGLQVGGIAVGGMDIDAARSKLVRRVIEPRRRSLRVAAGDRRYELTPRQLAYRVEIEPALREALERSREGNFITRSAKRLTGDRIDRNIELSARYDRKAARKLIDRIAADVNRRPVDASVEPSASGLETVPGRPGRELDKRKLRWRIAAAIRNPERGARIEAPIDSTEPAVRRKDLAERYPAYIVIDRANFRLRFYRNLELVDTYPIAVGQAGLETPAGLFEVQWKETNPIWRVPNSDWAGDLAGRHIPPGPDNPIKARWMAFNGAAGIHGTDNEASLGTNASHGCIRMRISDVIELYSRAPVHTPVYVA